MPDIRQTDDMGSVVQKLLAWLARPFQFEGRILQVTASAGVTTYPEDGEEPETLLRNADLARARAKDLGRGSFQLCTAELTAKAVERLDLQSGLQRALQKRGVLPQLPADRQPGVRPRRRLRGARPLAASGERHACLRRGSSPSPRRPA